MPMSTRQPYGVSIKNAIIIIIIIIIKDVITHCTKCYNTKVTQILVLGKILIILSRRLRIFYLVSKLYTRTVQRLCLLFGCIFLLSCDRAS